MKEANSPPPAVEPASTTPNLSPGMATLLRGNTGAARHTQTANQPDRTTPLGAHAANAGAAAPSFTLRRKRLLQASLLMADLVLCGLAVRVVRHGPVGFAGIALCVLALGLGAWLVCLALWPQDENS